jgi:hypothetical protein
VRTGQKCASISRGEEKFVRSQMPMIQFFFFWCTARRSPLATRVSALALALALMLCDGLCRVGVVAHVLNVHIIKLRCKAVVTMRFDAPAHAHVPLAVISPHPPTHANTHVRARTHIHTHTRARAQVGCD